jgi:hypothetical protein
MWQPNLKLILELKSVVNSANKFTSVTYNFTCIGLLAVTALLDSGY